MKNNERLIQKVRKILNTNKKCQDMMEVLVNKAKSVGMSAEQFEQFKNYAHIFALEVDTKYRERGLGRVLIKHAKEKLEANSTSQSKGFTINFDEAKSKELYNNIGFKEVFEDKDKKVKIMYAKYENIDTKH